MKSPLTQSSEIPKSKRKSSDQEGFTLLEVIVALAIMAIGFITVLKLFSTSVRSVGMSDQYLKAVTLANSKLGELELMDFRTEESSGVFKNEENYRWEMDIRPYDSTLNDAESGIDLSEVILKVLWNDGDQERLVELATLQIRGTTIPITDEQLSSVFSSSGSTLTDEAEESSSEESESQHLCGALSGSGSISGSQTSHISGSQQ